MGESPSPRGPDRAGAAPDRFGLVLALLLGSFLLTAFLPGERLRALPLLLYLAALILALHGAYPGRRDLRRLYWALALLTAVAVVLLILAPTRLVRGLISLWIAAILTLAIVAVVRRTLSHRVVTLQTIFGALNAYLLIGFFYAALFGAVAAFHHGVLFTNGQPANNNTIQYFSFITMTTVGYGDFTPASEPSRTLAVFDALTGQIFLVTLVARLVSTFGTARRGR
ncbi:ion channel [Micromonospora yasonensis]|uniref:potassium channel family protein n=1 Tax=Micromonospora yasonensis TaxID=1128667 RepID=UPI0022320728|nr:potassium channel family protein [Micromonospora yasonensis]MCW3845071.1 ion channel [Micromonospora yasonensis]